MLAVLMPTEHLSGIKLIGGSNADNLSFSVAQGGVAFDLGDGVDTLTLGDGCGYY